MSAIGHRTGPLGLLSFLKRLFSSTATSDEDSAQRPRYVDEKRAKAIRQAALFEESHGTKGAPQCHRCGAEMILQMSPSGARFWGCSEYPACKTTRKV